MSLARSLSIKASIDEIELSIESEPEEDQIEKARKENELLMN